MDELKANPEKKIIERPFDFDNLVRVGDLVCIVVDSDLPNTVRWMVYEGTIDDKEAFLEGIVDTKMIYSWRVEKAHLKFSNGGIEFDRFHRTLHMYIPKGQEYKIKKAMLILAGLM